MREGARLESRLMVVRSSGENLLLEAEDDKQSFEALENLSLERILQAVRADSNDKRWLVTGKSPNTAAATIFCSNASLAPANRQLVAQRLSKAVLLWA